MKNLLYTILIFSVWSCSEQSKQKELLQILNNSFGLSSEKYKGVILIPNEGCGGCISDASYYINENANLFDDYAIIYYAIDDLKLFRLTFTHINLNKNNFFIDSLNTLDRPTIRDIYPKVYFFSGNKIKNKGVFSKKHFVTSLDKDKAS